ncbi:MAG: beta-ketoacyl synthase N-terminal-like domain-containing protein [Cyanobacteria bacterium P01_H01_bin.121]
MRALQAARSQLEAVEAAKNERVAIIGMSGRFPGADNLAEFWNLLRDGRSGIQLLSEAELLEAGVAAETLAQPNYVRAYASFPEPTAFDAGFFGYAPREAAIMDPQQCIFLEAAWSALEDAGYDSQQYDGSIGVFAGAALNTHLVKLAQHPQFRDSVDTVQAVVSNVMGLLPARVSYHLDLKGPSCGVQTGCSTSLVSVHLACQSVLNQECDLAIAGGVTVSAPTPTGYLYQPDGVVSPNGQCCAFDAAAKGTVFGNGVGVVVLKRLSAAIADGDHIYAVIKGSAVNNDGSEKVGLTAPSVAGQAAVIAAALEKAGVESSSINYVEAHGTGTALGDPIEVAALNRVFGTGDNKGTKCAIGSVKPTLGHLDAAAGVAGLIKTTLAMTHHTLPASLNFKRPNPKIDFEHSPFVVQQQSAAWSRNGKPRRAGVSSFGMGGTNAHLILEEAPVEVINPSEVSARSDWQLLVLAAKTPTALEAATANLATYLETQPEVNLADVAYTLQVGRRALPQRRICVCRTPAEAIAQLTTHPASLASQTVAGEASVVFLLAGESHQNLRQALEQSRELYDSEPHFRQALDRCAIVLDALLDQPLLTLLYGSQNQPLTGNEGAIATFVLDYALAQLWLGWGIKPQALLGEGIGEWVAACLAGIFSLEEALQLVLQRSTVLQQGQPATLLTEMLKAITLRPPTLDLIATATGTWMTAEQATNPNYWLQALRPAVTLSQSIAELTQLPKPLFLEMGAASKLAAQIAQQAQLTVLSALTPSAESAKTSLLNCLGQIWLAGGSVNWQEFHRPTPRRRVPLPTYPFERQRCWVPPQSAEVQAVKASVTDKANMTDWFYLPTWQRSLLTTPSTSGASSEQLSSECWLLLVDQQGLGTDLQQALAQTQASVVVVQAGTQFAAAGDRYTLNPQNQGDYQLLAENLQANGQWPTRVVHLWGVGLDAQADAKADSKLGFYSLLYLVQALTQSELQTDPTELQIAIVTTGVHEVVSYETLNPDNALLLGLCKVIPQEYPQIRCRNLDLILPAVDAPALKPTVQALGERIYTELTTPAQRHETVVAYRDGYRWVQNVDPLPLNPPLPTMGEGETEPTELSGSSSRYREEAGWRAARLRSGGVYVIAGDIVEGLGLVYAQALVQSVQAKLIIFGRPGLPEPNDWERWFASHGPNHEVSRCLRKLQSLGQVGQDFLWFSLDLADPVAVQAALDQGVKTFGDLNGVIHAATMGDRASCLIENLTPAECEVQFHSKIKGLQVLEDAILAADQRVDFYLLQSSLSSIVGGVGFAAYTAANLHLDAVTNQHRHPQQPAWISINWDACQLEDLDPTTDSALLNLAMTPTEVWQVTERVLSQPHLRQVAVSPSDLKARIKQWIEEPETLAPARSDLKNPNSSDIANHDRPALSNAYIAPRDAIEAGIVQIMQELLGIEKIGVEDNFFELGGHSLLAIQAVTQLRSKFQVDLPMRAFLFEAPTITGIANIIREQQTAAENQSDIASLLSEIEDMSPEEVALNLEKS